MENLPASRNCSIAWFDDRRVHACKIGFSRAHIHLGFQPATWGEHQAPRDRKTKYGDATNLYA